MPWSYAAQSITCRAFKFTGTAAFLLILFFSPICFANEQSRLQDQIEKLTRQLEVLQQEVVSLENTAESTEEPELSHSPLLVLAPGRGEIDFGFSYIQSSSSYISIDGFTVDPVFVVGEIVSEDRRKEDVVTSLSLSYGLPWRSQLNLYVPYRLQTLRSVDSTLEQSTSRNNGIGDIEIGISKQIMEMPWQSDFDYLATLTWKTTTGQESPDLDSDLTTGTGFHGLRLSISAIKSATPAVLILSGSYSHNFGEDVLIDDQPTRFEPGNSLNLGVSMSLALNRSISLNYGFQQQYNDYAKIGGVRATDSSLMFGNFIVGLGYRLSSGNWVNLNMVMGLSREAPDYQFSIKAPVFRF